MNENEPKLIDFGFAAIQDDENTLSAHCGTPSYMAPEIVNKKSYGNSVDIWACGIVLYVMLTGVFPFKANNE